MVKHKPNVSIDANAIFNDAARNAARSAAHYHGMSRTRATLAPVAYVTKAPSLWRQFLDIITLR